MRVDQRPTHISTPPANETARLDRRRLLRRSAVRLAVPAALAVAGQPAGWAGAQSADATPATPPLEGANTAANTLQTGYAPVNGLSMYYEIHGTAPAEVPPLLLLHGSMGSLEMFRGLLPALTQTRQVIAVDQQAHGRTADIDRPLRYEQLADDAAAFLRLLGVERADVFGFSMGSAAGWQLAIRHPDLVRKLVGGISYTTDGIYPEVMAGLEIYFTPEVFADTPIEADYRGIAPNPDDFPTLVAKVLDLTRSATDWSAETVRAIAAPTLIVIGDADIIRPEHAVELFRLRGGGVPGDFVPMPAAQLAVLPGTTHTMLIARTEWLESMIPAFLDAPMSEGR